MAADADAKSGFPFEAEQKYLLQAQFDREND